MPFGQFLDSYPDALFIAAHLAFLVVGLWAIRAGRDRGLGTARWFVLYVLSQVGFLFVFAHVITVRTGVLIDQTLIVAMVLLLVATLPQRQRDAA